MPCTTPCLAGRPRCCCGAPEQSFGDARYAKLAGISVSHLYNLRASAGYRKQRIVWSRTRPTPVKIGVRKAPAPQGLPGYIRIDTVHQGDQDGLKGVYHVNAVDIVTQWEVVAAVERIGEAFLLPVIALMLDSFPSTVRGFHSAASALSRALARCGNSSLELSA
jgi:hypothetical protein